MAIVLDHRFLKINIPLFFARTERKNQNNACNHLTKYLTSVSKQYFLKCCIKIIKSSAQLLFLFFFSPNNLYFSQLDLSFISP